MSSPAQAATRSEGATTAVAEPGLPRRLVGETVEPGDVLCAIVDGPADQLATTVAFLADGLARGERGILLAEQRFVDRVWAALPADRPIALERHPVEAVTNRDQVLREWRFDSDRVVALVARVAAEARAAGSAGTRVCIDMTWALRPTGAIEEVDRLARCLASALAPLAGVGLLLYDRIRFLPAFIEAALRAHPLVVRGERVLRNPYVLPQERARRAVDQMLAFLDRSAPTAASPTMALEEILDALPHGAVVVDQRGVIQSVNRAAASLLETDPAGLAGAPLATLFADGSPPEGWPTVPGPDRRNLRLRRGDGRAVWLRAWARRLDGETAGLLVLLDTHGSFWPLWSDADRRDPRSRRVLVVSPEPALAETLALQLMTDGHVVTTVSGGVEAEVLQRATSADLAVVDLDDPEGRAGHAWFEALRAASPSLPLVVLTAWPRVLDDDTSGARAVLVKPYSFTQLRHVVQTVDPRAPDGDTVTGPPTIPQAVRVAESGAVAFARNHSREG